MQFYCLHKASSCTFCWKKLSKDYFIFQGLRRKDPITQNNCLRIMIIGKKTKGGKASSWRDIHSNPMFFQSIYLMYFPALRVLISYFQFTQSSIVASFSMLKDLTHLSIVIPPDAYLTHPCLLFLIRANHALTLFGNSWMIQAQKCNYIVKWQKTAKTACGNFGPFVK